MYLTNFQGDFADISAEKEALHLTKTCCSQNTSLSCRHAVIQLTLTTGMLKFVAGLTTTNTCSQTRSCESCFVQLSCHALSSQTLISCTLMFAWNDWESLTAFRYVPIHDECSRTVDNSLIVEVRCLCLTIAPAFLKCTLRVSLQAGYDQQWNISIKMYAMRKLHYRQHCH